MDINYEYNQISEYLTEKSLGEFLQDFLPECEIIHDKIIPGSGIKNRPDYRIEELKLLIEFNGKHHYTNIKSILSDYKKKSIYEEMGYTIKSIPYWIQLRREVIYYLFHDKIKIDVSKLKDYNTYPLGFIDKNCPLPSMFCELGNKEVLKEWHKWNGVIDKYYKYFDFTLIEKILEKDSFLEVSNETIMPYFRKFWKNKGQGFGWNIQTEYFPVINKEIEMLNKWDEKCEFEDILHKMSISFSLLNKEK